VRRELQKMYRSRGLEANGEVEIIRVMLKERLGKKEVMVLATGWVGGISIIGFFTSVLYNGG